MAMTKSELKNAFREAASYEFSEIPQNDSEIAYECSSAFEEKLDKLIKKNQKFTWRMVNTFEKRAACFAAVFVMLCLTACSVPAIRESIVNFIIEKTDISNDYEFEGNITDTISREYEMTYIPEGFTLTDTFRSDPGITKTYENEAGDRIRFSQIITDGGWLSVDSERSEFKILEVAGNETHLYTWDGISFAMWSEDSYLFEISYHGTISEEDLIKLIESVE